MAAVIRSDDTSMRTGKASARSKASLQEDHFNMAISIALLTAVAIVCAVMIAVPVLTTIL